MIKFTLGVNFINILQADFTRADPKSAKKIDNLTVFFTLLGSTSIKAEPKLLGEIDQNKMAKRGRFFFRIQKNKTSPFLQ